MIGMKSTEITVYEQVSYGTCSVYLVLHCLMMHNKDIFFSIQIFLFTRSFHIYQE